MAKEILVLASCFYEDLSKEVLDRFFSTFGYDIKQHDSKFAYAELENFNDYSFKVTDQEYKNTLPERFQDEEFKISLYKITGALELPLLAKKFIDTGEYDAIVATGIVIKGGTTHFEHVCQESIHFLQKLSLKKSFPIGNAILTLINRKQIQTRYDKALEAFRACLEVMDNTMD